MLFREVDDESSQSSDRNREVLQNDLYNIVKWAEKWKMKFNVDNVKSCT